MRPVDEHDISPEIHGSTGKGAAVIASKRGSISTPFSSPHRAKKGAKSGQAFVTFRCGTPANLDARRG
ncbi:hypothetical protein [Burkholderia gladioli]|uniref:hypothetical protein n=1 Tax=Burkholderia gladioli TaxID=28095 RepID=UPI0016404C16|nr:hypothetical protein [Burkholderia gladioli]MDC6131781.1 hypothetical protein [Burkholderia gladioli]